MDSRTALRQAITSVPVPGAPPRQTGAAAIGLSYLDSALRLNHVRRLTDRLTITDHRVARRITEIDISLRMLDPAQRHVATLARELRNAGPREDGAQQISQADRIWVPVARIDRQSAAAVEVSCAAGARLPRLTQFEASRLLSSGLFRLLHGILDSLPSVGPGSDLHRFLYRAHEAEWLVQQAIDILLTERHRPEQVPGPAAGDGMLEGQGARYRSLALGVLDKYDDVLAEFFELFDITLENELLIVALDPTTDEHLVTYETALHVAPEIDPTRRVARMLRSSSDGYTLDYRSTISSSVPAYHLVVQTEPGVDIARMYLSTDADLRTAQTLRTDLTVLAQRLENQRREAEQGQPRRASSKILELQMQTTLRTLADLVRRRRWEAAQAGFAVPTPRMVACTSLARVAVAGEGTAGRQGEVDSSILRHPRLFPEQLRQAAEELIEEELYLDLALENDPTSNRAHANWRGSPRAARNASPIQVRASMLLRDNTAAGPRRVCLYALLVAVVGYFLAACLARVGWPFGQTARAALGAITDADAVIAVLLLVPGFLYTRLGLAERHSIAGHLRALPRLVANTCIGIVATVGAVVASGLPGGWVQLAFATMVAVPLAGAGLLLYHRRTGRQTAELVRLGAPRWLDGADVSQVPCDARFYSTSGGASRTRPGHQDDPATTSTRALADLARAGYRVLHEPSMQVEFEIHHVSDRPGRLAEIVALGPAGTSFAETLSSCAHGAGLVIGTRIGDSPRHPGSPEHQYGTWVQLERDADGRAGFRGSERPNLTFQHESAQTFEGVISIEDEPKRALLRHGLAVSDTMAHIAETALHGGEAALLSLQCPAQLPPTNSFWEGSGVDGRIVEPARSSSNAIRFSMALERPSADIRLQVADRLARHCEERGLGLWLADTRPGYRAGNWFLVLPHDRAVARAAYRRDADRRRAGHAADGCLPLTLVGPARQGSVHAILSFLGQFRAIGALACSMSVLDELAFLHLQLCVAGASRARLAAVNAGLRDLRTAGSDPADVLPRVVRTLLSEPLAERPVRELTERLVDRAGDYQTVVGPALPVVADGNVRRVPIWLSWRMRRSTAGLRTLLLALDRAMDRLGLLSTDAANAPGGAPNIEYLVCRQLGTAMLRGKGKLAVARELVARSSKDNRRGTARLAADLEEAWKAELRAAGEEHRFSEISVSSREFLLGDGQSLL